MKRSTYLAITGGVVLCLALIFTYTGVQSDEAGASGTSLFSCGKMPTGPEADAKIAPEPESDVQGSGEAMVQLLVGDVEYADQVGSNRWRATFEVRLLLPTGENDIESSEFTFYTMRNRNRPLIYDDGWLPIGNDSQYIDRGLLSYEGEWSDSEPAQSEDPIWFMVYVVDRNHNIDSRLIWEGDFSESVEQPTQVWDREKHLRYEPENDRVVVSQSVDFQQLN